MLITIPADHESVLTLRDALDEDNDMQVVETAMIGGCAETGVDKDAYEVLAMAPQYCRHVLLLRRNADGVLGILSTPSDEDDADMDPAQRATYDPVRADERVSVTQELANWMPNSCIENVGEVMTALVDDAVAVPETQADLVASSARLLTPALDSLRVSAEDLRDERIHAIVTESLARIDAALAA
jgi:hypothetical protein